MSTLELMNMFDEIDRMNGKTLNRYKSLQIFTSKFVNSFDSKSKVKIQNSFYIIINNLYYSTINVYCKCCGIMFDRNYVPVSHKSSIVAMPFDDLLYSLKLLLASTIFNLSDMNVLDIEIWDEKIIADIAGRNGYFDLGPNMRYHIMHLKKFTPEEKYKILETFNL